MSSYFLTTFITFFLSVPQLTINNFLVYRSINYPDRKVGEEIQQPYATQFLLTEITTVDYVEALSGLDFLNRLPDDVESGIESRKAKDVSFW